MVFFDASQRYPPSKAIQKEKASKHLNIDTTTYSLDILFFKGCHLKKKKFRFDTNTAFVNISTGHGVIKREQNIEKKGGHFKHNFRFDTNKAFVNISTGHGVMKREIF